MRFLGLPLAGTVTDRDQTDQAQSSHGDRARFGNRTRGDESGR